MFYKCSLDSISEQSVGLYDIQSIRFDEFEELFGCHSAYQSLVRVPLNLLFLPKRSNLLILG
jgi:hypothetical protein